MIKNFHWEYTTEVFKMTLLNNNTYTVYIIHSTKDFEPEICIINDDHNILTIDDEDYEFIRKIFT